jgi:hypothetical protein
VQEINLSHGSGYWLRFENYETVTLAGNGLNQLIIDLNQGWNLISGLSYTVEINAIGDNDGIIVSGTIYGFGSGGYSNSEYLEPGMGYWIRANSSGIITLENY